MADVIKSVGSGGGRDYSTIAAAVAALPSNLVTADQNWIFELYNDSEFSTNLNLTGHTTDATRCITFRAASGQGIKHASDKLSTARRYNQAKGVGIIIPGDFLQDGWVIADNYVFIEGLQFHHSGSNTTYNLITWNGNNGRLKDCLVQDSGAQGSGRALVRINGSSGMVNVLGIERNTLQPDRVGFQIENDAGYAINCGCLRTVTDGGSNRAAYERGYNSPLIRNCWAFGWSKFGRDTTAAAGSGYNATNLASGNTPGSNNQYSLTAANELESVTANSEDCRLKSGSTIKTLGTRDQTYTSDLDMLGEARSTSTPAIGPLEYAAPPAGPVITDPSASATGNGTANAAVSTTGTDGTLYAVVSAAQPSNAQIVAGQDSTGAASQAGSLAITSAGSKTIGLTGVSPGSRTVWFLHRPASGSSNDSNVVSASWSQPPYFSAGATLGAVVAGGNLGSGGTFGAGATLGAVVAGGTLSLAPGVLTSQALRTNNGTLLASTALDYVDVYLESSGALVGRFTGLSTNGAGVFTVTSALLTPGTAYKLDWRASGGHRRMPAATAA